MVSVPLRTQFSGDFGGPEDKEPRRFFRGEKNATEFLFQLGNDVNISRAKFYAGARRAERACDSGSVGNHEAMLTRSPISTRTT
jgi:hypothetical protein